MNDSDPGVLDEVVRAAHDAMLASDWDRLRLILHPYLHWTAADGSRLRGGPRLWIGCRTQRRRPSRSLLSCATGRYIGGKSRRTGVFTTVK
jgi:hypothetical protein